MMDSITDIIQEIWNELVVASAVEAPLNIKPFRYLPRTTGRVTSSTLCTASIGMMLMLLFIFAI
jgi:hypothetical protein